jgi:predicted ATP-binding protein involved in virulence
MTNDERQALSEWYTNWPQLDRIVTIRESVEKFAEQIRQCNAPLDAYLDIVNGFFEDSHKKLEFSRAEGLQVSLKSREVIPVTALSSGESQILILISHLAFNPAVDTANVFIVDEPELSLHLRWQEIFVKSLRRANPNIQLILATHSPSIIMDDTAHCVDLSESINA